MKELSEAQGLIDFYAVPEPKSQHRWILVRKLDGAKLGTCGFHCWNPQQQSIETGYDMRKEMQRKREGRCQEKILDTFLCLVYDSKGVIMKGWFYHGKNC